MNKHPERKNIRIEHYDYSAPGAYFVTVCTSNREKILWKDVGADSIRPCGNCFRFRCYFRQKRNTAGG